jgi:cation diffusion facilitator family transporter
MTTAKRTPPGGERPIAVFGAIAANIGVAIAKFGAAVLTGSSAMISEGIHSIVDTGDQVLLLLGIHRSRRPPDREHPFGHGKELYFWSLIVAIVLFGVGGGMSFYEGATQILDPTPLEDPLPSYLVLVIAFILEGGSWIVAARRISREAGETVLEAIHGSKDPSVVTVLLEDSAALVGLVVAGLGIALAHQLDDPRIDGVASLLIGATLSIVAVYLAFESRGLLIGEGADPEVIDLVRRVAGEDAGVERVERIRTMHLGPAHVVLTMRVHLVGGADGDAARTMARVESRLRDADPRLDDVTIQPVE